MPGMHDFTMNDIDGNAVNLADFAGQTCLIVNLASR